MSTWPVSKTPQGLCILQSAFLRTVLLRFSQDWNKEKQASMRCEEVFAMSLSLQGNQFRKNPKGARPKNKYNHKCGWGECPFCLQQVEQNKHKCFIQPIDPNEDEPQLKKVKEGEIGNRKAYVDQDGSLSVEKSPPLFVYADYEAVTDDRGVQSPILVCRESEGGHEPPHFYTEDFFNYLNDMVSQSMSTTMNNVSLSYFTILRVTML